MSFQKRSFVVTVPRSVILQPVRHKPKRTRQVVFELSDVVLDLDAEDNPHVRPFDEQDAAQQKAKWGYSPIIPETEQLAEELRTEILKDGIKMRQMLAARHHPFKISDHDVLSVALLGGDATASSLHSGEAVDEGSHRRNALLKGRDRAMHANGIPQRILASDANTIIHFMLHRQQQAPAPHDTAASANPGLDAKTSDTFEGAVERCRSLAQLERLCSNSLSSEPEAITPASMDRIARGLENFKDITLDHTRHALKIVNNLTIRRLSANADLGPSMSLVGLVMAAKLSLLPIAMHYLHICLSQGFIGKPQDKPETLGAVGQGILEALEKGDGSARGTRPELFTLLTGRTLAGSAVQPSLFGSSISSNEEDPHTHHIHVQLLGQLGAYRLLWHSWKRGADERTRHHERFYYAAFLRCAEVLRGAKSVPGLDCTTATGDLERDAKLDLQAIDALDAHHASCTSSEPLYASRIENPPPSDEIKEVFESPDIYQAVARINDLIANADVASPES